MPFDPAAAQRAIRAAALAYPETTEDRPWDHPAFKIRGKKAFVFMGEQEDRLSLSLKLPDSHQAALDLPFCAPTGYGLGKHGWVSITIPADQDLPIDALVEWIDESYRAVAPKSLSKTLPVEGVLSAAAEAIEALG